MKFFKERSSENIYSLRKVLDDNDEEDDEEFDKFALIANSNDEVSTFSSYVPSLLSFDMTNEQYKKTVESLSINILTFILVLHY